MRLITITILALLLISCHNPKDLLVEDRIWSDMDNNNDYYYYDSTTKTKYTYIDLNLFTGKERISDIKDLKLPNKNPYHKGIGWEAVSKYDLIDNGIVIKGDGYSNSFKQIIKDTVIGHESFLIMIQEGKRTKKKFLSKKYKEE